MTTTQTNDRPGVQADGIDDRINEVRLVGRVGGAPTLVELPSGDRLVTFRVSVERAAVPGRSARSPTGQRVDSIPCTAWAGGLTRRVLQWRRGDVVEVVGAVRCRFYQAGGATRSRVEVEATRARIIRRAPVA